MALRGLRGKYAPRAGIKSLQIPEVCGGGLTVSFRGGSQQEDSNCARLFTLVATRTFIPSPFQISPTVEGAVDSLMGMVRWLLAAPLKGRSRGAKAVEALRSLNRLISPCPWRRTWRSMRR